MSRCLILDKVFFEHAAIGIVALQFLMFTHSICAQSSVIQLPGNASVIAATSESSPNDFPSSVSEQVKRTEKLLRSPTPMEMCYESDVSQLLEQFREFGIQIVLDESAAENNLDEDTDVRLRLPGVAIDVNLRDMLKPYQCKYSINESGVVTILSEDANEELFIRLTYDISNIAGDFDGVDQLMGLVQETIDPDSWEENGGNGRMYPVGTGNRMLLTISQTYRNQRQIRSQLGTIRQMSGGSWVKRGASAKPRAGTSSVVALPEKTYLQRRKNRRGMSLPGSGSTSGFGGGAGLGGGVF